MLLKTQISLLCMLFGLCPTYMFGQSSPEDKTSFETKLSDEELMDKVQFQTFNYFWEGAEPNTGMARERIHTDGVYPQNDADVVTTGGTGFGLMAILVGIERGFISRKAGRKHIQKIVTFLGKTDRYHGVWPHWIHGSTGKTKAFSPKDDGGDLVETAYLVQGLLCVRQYFKDGNRKEQKLAAEINGLWLGVEWDWYQNKENVLFWHWSPKHNWEMNLRITGYNECLIAYVLAASSPIHPISAKTYHEGWARSGKINAPSTEFGLTLNLEHNGAKQYGGPLFWSHYSFLGLDPRNLKDPYADYWTHNQNHVLIDYQYCLTNPHQYKGYGPNCWGLTASYSLKFYTSHHPAHDLGVISPTAALASFPYTPSESMAAMKHFYHDLGPRLWGPYGFYDAFSIEEDWFPTKYLAIDQGPIVVMIENHRSALIWDLFMSCPEVKAGLEVLGFERE